MTDHAGPTDGAGMTGDAAMRELLAPIWARNRDKLLIRLARVRAAVTGRDTVAMGDLRADLHALIGALGTYGWPEGSALLARVQERVVAGQSAADLAGELDTLAATLTEGSASR